MFDPSHRPRLTHGRLLASSSLAVTAVVLAWTQLLPAHGGGGLSAIFLYLFTVDDAAALRCTLLVIAVAACIPGGWSTRPILRWLGDHPLWIAVTVAVVYSWASWSVYQHWALSMDEYAALFQSRVFAAGHLRGQFPPPLVDWLIPKGFQHYFFNVTPDGRVTSGYWPSFALLLTPFTRLGVPWMCNPLLSAATLLAVHRLALRVFADREGAGLAVLLTVASPEFFADGISYYSMQAHLLANTLYAVLLATPTVRRATAAGIIGSLALSLHNPVPHLLFALPWMVFIVRRTADWKIGAALLAGYLPGCLLLGFGWFFATATVTATAAAAAASAAAATAAASALHAVVPVARLPTIPLPFTWPTSPVMLARAVGIAKLWAWSVPALLILAPLGAWKWRRDPLCRLLTLSAVLTLFGYVFVPVDQGHGWGYRYFHSAWMVLPLLTTAALCRLPGPAAHGTPGTSVHGTPGPAAHSAPGTARQFLVACAVLTLVASTGLRALQIHAFIARARSEVPRYAGTEPHVVILDVHDNLYRRDLIQNDPWLRNDVIWMITHGTAADARMMQQEFPTFGQVYADRFGTVWSAAGSRPAQPSR